MFKFKKNFILLFLFISTFAFSQSVIPFVTIEEEVKNLFWNSDSTGFIYSKKNKIITRSTTIFDETKENFPITNTLEISGDEIKEVFVSDNPQDNSFNQILTVCKDNTIEYIHTNDFNTKFFITDNKSHLACKHALSKSGNYFVIAYTDGTVGVFSYDIFQQKYTRTNLNISESGNFSYISVNSNDTILITAFDNGFVYLWNLLTGTLMHSFSYFYNKNCREVFLADNSNKLIYLNSINEICVYDFTSESTNFIKIDDPIKKIAISPDETQIFVLTDKNVISIFDVSTQTFIGDYISANQKVISTFAIDKSNSKFIIGHKDGTILISSFAKRFVPTSRFTDVESESDYFDFYGQNEITDFSSEVKNDGKSEKKSSKKKNTFKIIEENENFPLEENNDSTVKKDDSSATVESNYASIFRKNINQISLKARCFIFPQPFTLGFSLGGSYSNFKLLAPFYFGASGDIFLALADKNFPFSYQNENGEIPNPLFTSGKVMCFFGICVYPFVSNNVEFFADIGLGVEVNMLSNFSIGIFSNPYAAFCSSIKVGAGLNNFSVYFEANYSAITNFSFGIGINYNFSLKDKKKSPKENSL